MQFIWFLLAVLTLFAAASTTLYLTKDTILSLHELFGLTLLIAFVYGFITYGVIFALFI